MLLFLQKGPGRCDYIKDMGSLSWVIRVGRALDGLGSLGCLGPDLLTKSHFPCSARHPLRDASPRVGHVPSAAASPLPSPRQSQKMGKWWTRALGGGTSEPGSPRHGLTVPNQALAPLSSTQRLTGNFHSALLARRGRGQSYNGDGPCVFPLVSRPVALNAPWTSQGLWTGTAEHTRPSLTS